MKEQPEKPIFGPETPKLDPPNPPEVKVWRSVAKAFTWRLVGTIDTFVLSYVLITYLGPLFGMENAHGGVVAKVAGSIALVEVVTKMFFYFVHERLWARSSWGVGVEDGKRVESYARTTTKTGTWRVIASLDTMAIAFFFTGNIGTAISIGGLEVITKLILYFFHERAWSKLPFGIEVAPANETQSN